jgi:hypothetical protein
MAQKLMDSKASPIPTTLVIQSLAVQHPDLFLFYMEGP